MLKRKIGFKIPKFLDPVKKRAFFLVEEKSQENKIKKLQKLDSPISAFVKLLNILVIVKKLFSGDNRES